MTPFKIGKVYYAFWTCTAGYCREHPAPERHKTSLRTRDKREAVARCSELADRLEKEKARNALGLPVPSKGPGMTLAEYVDEYRTYGQPDKAYKTREKEDSLLRFLGEFAKSCTKREVLLSDLDQKLLEQYKRHRLETLAPRSWNSEIATLKAVFAWGMTRRPPYFSENPWQGVTRVDKGQPTIKKYVAPDEIDAAAASGDPFWLNVLDFLRVTWCRSGEMCNLRWEDVKWGAGYLEFVHPKEDRTKRLPLTSALLQILKKAKELGQGEYVFSQNGRLDVNRVSRKIKHLGKKAGVKLSPHMLRHSGITNALAQGAPLFAVQAVVGHSNVSTTQNYEHTALSSKQAAMEAAKYLGTKEDA
jgi:integrase